MTPESHPLQSVVDALKKDSERAPKSISDTNQDNILVASKDNRAVSVAPVVQEKPVASTKQVHPSSEAITKTACSGNVDPFAGHLDLWFVKTTTQCSNFSSGQSIELFHPPETASFSDVMKWEDMKREILGNLKRMMTGGDKLRVHIRNEAQRLKLLRFEIFCKYVTV